MTTSLPIIIVILNLEQQSVPALISRSNAIITGMAANLAFFPKPTLPLTAVQGHVADLVLAEAALKNRTGVRATRDGKKKQLVDDMHTLHAYVQQLASANPAQAEEIAAAAAMTLKKKTAPQKHPLAVKQAVSGSAKVVAKATKGAHANEWQMSTDAGKTWVALQPTLAARTTVQGLQVGALVQFRHRPILKTGPANWTDAISYVVT